MNKKNLLLIVLSISMLSLSAEPRTESEAMNLARQFEKSGPVKIRSHSQKLVDAPTLAYVAECNNAEPAYYAFNYGNGKGFVLVSAEDKTFPILGYSEEGSFDYSNVPENMRWWLSQYVKQIEYAKAHSELSAAPTKVPTTTSSVAPLLNRTMWNQGSPYNLLCPTYTYQGQTYKGVSGCVATAMAQIMYYHKWPKKGEGSKTYTSILNGDESQTKQLTVNFAESEYGWENMTPVYNSASTEESNKAVAKLVYDCGVSVNMAYGSTSLAVTEHTIGALAKYFGYDKSIDYLERDLYTCAQWDELLRAEMDAKRPVLYSGRNEEGGHAFVLDGYDTSGYYHVNWGWGGMSNGYFLFYDLTPNSQGLGGSRAGYNEDQGMVVGIKKDEGGTNKPHLILRGLNLFDTDMTEVGLNEPFYLKYDKIQIVTAELEGLNPYVGYGIYKEDGTLVAGQLSQNGTMQNGYMYTSPITACIPSTVSDGKYQLKAVCSFASPQSARKKSVSSDKFADVQVIPTVRYADQYIQVEVKDGKAYFTMPDAETYSLKERAMAVTSGKVYSQRSFKVKATVSNESSEEYQDDLYIALIDGDGAVKSVSSSVAVYIPQGGTEEIETVIGANITAGNYILKVLDGDEAEVGGEGLAVEVLAEPAEADLQITSQLVATKASVDLVEAKATIKNEGGYFAGNINLIVLENDNNTVLQLVPSGFVSIENSEEKEVNYSFMIPGASVGDKYRILLCDPTITSYYQAWGNICNFTLDETSGITGEHGVDGELQVYPNPVADVVTVTSPADISRISLYTMDGARVIQEKIEGARSAQVDVSSLSAGQYIVKVENAEGVEVKVLIKK